MKAHIFFRIFLILLITSSWAKAQTENEPNNDMLHAEYSNVNMNYTGRVSNITDDAIDYYSFSSATNCVLEISVKNDTTLGLTDNSLNTVNIIESNTTFSSIPSASVAAGLTAVTNIMCEANKIYYIAISTLTPTSVVPYTLSLTKNTTFLSDNRTEYNNTKTTAYSLTKSNITGTVGLFGDSQDWYAIKFTADGTYSLTVFNTSTNPDVQLGLNTI